MADGLRHSLTRKPDITAKVTMQIGDILKNAIIINELNPRGTTSGGYVLIGIGVDEDNNYYPTRIIVNNYEVNDIENLDVVYAIISKKKNQFPKGTGSAAETAPLIKGSSDVTIADFLDVVKDYFADILPQNVLEPGFNSIYADTKLCGNLF